MRPAAAALAPAVPALVAALASCAPAPGVQPPWLGGEHYTVEWRAAGAVGDALERDAAGVEIGVAIRGR